MTVETLLRFKELFSTISDKTLIQADAVIQAEMIRRGALLRRPPKSPPGGEFKDCEPNHGD